MKPVLIGSRAVSIWFPDFKCREDSDWDLIGEPQDMDVEGRIEWHDPDHLNNRHTGGFLEDKFWVASKITLAAIYRSHLHRPYKWDHNICVYHKFLRPHFYDIPFYQERKRLTYEAYGNRHPKLSQSNEDFFDDNVEKVYDHDYLHELYAYYERPLFERLKHDNERDKAWCVKDLWDQLSYKDKVKCVAEETYVIATERFLIPSDYKDNYKYSYYRALRKVCTTLTSGWFRDFAIDNFPEVWKKFDTDKINQVKGRLK